ncbi:MAG: CoB--CoM heterodisulfide reductase iron-sulfur subunit A family protein, partial [Desulfosoma sp.]|uniref:CoB--CoM heterodisulfide reductase iron-sulfur subunit A family protein n=1 Tax=Desulfosoma sp. TaxID=2603217 RepID=UPI0040499B9C
TLIQAGLNKYLLEMANIRNHDSWVHSSDPAMATEKAKDLVRMAVAKVALLEPLPEPELSVTRRALVLGGGVAGMTAALSLADQGYPVNIVESGAQLGGQALRLHSTWRGEDIAAFVEQLRQRVNAHERITVHLNARLSQVEGFVGNFKSVIQNGAEPVTVEHGVAIIATGGREWKPDEYLYGQHPGVLTQLELDEKLRADDPALAQAKSVVFIQCVGSREPQRPYCSRVCCTHTLQSALEIKRRSPDTNVYVLYRDMRSYGEREILYQEARRAGVLFIRYSLKDKPKVTSLDGTLTVTVTDHILRRPLVLSADFVTLATAVLPNVDEALAQLFKVPINEDGFLVEAHAKLRPVDFATDGVFLCGLAHYPKPLDESIAQAQAAAARAATVLARDRVHFPGTVARTNPFLCSACGTCVAICPYSAPRFNERGVAEINPALCKGCGLCVASCRSGAIQLQGFDDAQILTMIDSL